MGAPEARIAVLASGRGSNLRAIAAACDGGSIPGRITAVVSDVEDAGALEFARERGIASRWVPKVSGRPRREHDDAILGTLRELGPDLVCLAGYMRIVAPEVVAEFRWRLLNIHPSLLPAFPGLHAQRQALEAGVKVSGCTVHFVDEGLDSGPILVQRAVPVLDSDDEGALSARILVEEHVAYPEAIRRVLERRWRVEGRRVVETVPSPVRGIADPASGT